MDARNLLDGALEPRIPFVMAADGSRSVALAARLGDGWVTTGSRAAGPADWWQAVGDSMSRFTDALGARGATPAGCLRTCPWIVPPSPRSDGSAAAALRGEMLR
jgi:alkanesulfonate monooxygenase SsuD/methylene tetrahydromethanopterin reductase-like flavin-dependent oxidoreductase (luciferase family)